MCCKSAAVTSGWYEIFAMGVSLMNLLSLYLLVSRIISDGRSNHHVSWVQALLSGQRLPENIERVTYEKLGTGRGRVRHNAG